MRARAPKAGEPSAQARKVRANSSASKAATPSTPTCTPSTQTSQTTVANIGKAIRVLKCDIQAPGRGIQRASAGQALAARNGSAMPRPKAANTASACAVGIDKAAPSEAPMNGAVQGEATATARTPVRKESTIGCRARALAQALGSTEPISNTPARFRPIKVNSAAKVATTNGDCS